MITNETFIQAAQRRHREAYIAMSQAAAAYSLAFRPPSLSANPQPEPPELIAKRNTFLMARERFIEVMRSLEQANETADLLTRSGELLARIAKLRDDEAEAETAAWFDYNGRLTEAEVDDLAESSREIARVANFHD